MKVASTSRSYGARLVHSDFELVGKPAVVIKGSFKGYRALVIAVTSQNFIVQLEAKMITSGQNHTIRREYVSFSAKHLQALESHTVEVPRPVTPPQDSPVYEGVWDPSFFASEKSALQVCMHDLSHTIKLLNSKAVFKIKGTKYPGGFEDGQYEDFLAITMPVKDQTIIQDCTEILVSIARPKSKVPQTKLVPVRFLDPRPVCVGITVFILDGEFAGETGNVAEEQEYQYIVRVHAAGILVVVVDKALVIEIRDLQ